MTKKQRAKFPDYDDVEPVYDVEIQERYFQVQEKKESHSIRSYIREIAKDHPYDRELLYIVKTVNGLEPDYWINEQNRYWILKSIITGICKCDERYSCDICAMRFSKW